MVSATAAIESLSSMSTSLDIRQCLWNGVAACTTACVVAPLIACFDEAITRSSNGDENLWVVLRQRGMDIVQHPLQFGQSLAFRWVLFVYAATYFAANTVAPLSSLGFLATVIVTLVNMTCGIAKDSAFAKMFATSKEGGNNNNSKTPLSAFLVWFARDLVSFTFVLTLPQVIHQATNLDLRVSKFATPILAQYLTTPLHLLGLSLVNNRSTTKTLSQHWHAAILSGGYLSTVTARQMRIIPPYSIGGLLNGWILSLGENVLATTTTGGSTSSPAP